MLSLKALQLSAEKVYNNLLDQSSSIRYMHSDAMIPLFSCAIKTVQNKNSSDYIFPSMVIVLNKYSLQKGGALSRVSMAEY